MDSSDVVEVDSALVKTFDGDSIEVRGGVYLPPEALLRTTTELERLRERAALQAQVPNAIPIVACAAGVAGLLIGYWLASRGDD